MTADSPKDLLDLTEGIAGVSICLTSWRTA
jgi:hypothetical protein